jgi:hypothetical protein
MNMTDVNLNQSDLNSPMRDDLSHRRQPTFTPLDFIAFIVAVAMIWGPLAAGAMRH